MDLITAHGEFRQVRDRSGCGWPGLLAAVVVLPLTLSGCALGPDGTPCMITSDLRCLEMEYQRGNDGADPNYIDPSGAWEIVLDGRRQVLNFSALGGRMRDANYEYFLQGDNVWVSGDQYITIQFDSPERGYLWDDAAVVEGTLVRLTWG